MTSQASRRANPRASGRPNRGPSLQERLEPLYAAYDRAAVTRDPVELVRPFQHSADREVAAFVAAGLAFGQVSIVMRSVGVVLRRMGASPADYVRSFDPSRERAHFRAFAHRWTRGDDIVALLWILRRMLEEPGSIEGFFTAGDDPSAADVTGALESFAQRALLTDLRPAYGRVPPRPGVSYFFPRPSTGSACKRLNLFLRWMVRRDHVDLGVWTRISPSRLVMPLDVHVIRVGRCLRLTRYATPGWRMATDITAALRSLDPLDPVKYDFALCHVGMEGRCGYGRVDGDRVCPLKGACRPRSRAAATRRP